MKASFVITNFPLSANAPPKRVAFYELMIVKVCPKRGEGILPDI